VHCSPGFEQLEPAAGGLLGQSTYGPPPTPDDDVVDCVPVVVELPPAPELVLDAPPDPDVGLLSTVVLHAARRREMATK
jgi:hypothetical protein